MVVFISGTFCSLKSTLSIDVADRLNIANMISTDLIKVMMDSLRQDVKLPDHKQLLTSDISLDEFFQLNLNYWKGALMDVNKVFAERKNLIFEGVLHFKGIMDSPYKPSEERYNLARRFIDEDPTIDRSRLFDELNQNPEGLPAATFTDIQWLKKDAIKPELAIIDQFEKVKGGQGAAIPLILIINKRDHKQIVTEKLLKEMPWYETHFKPIAKVSTAVDQIVKVYQELQDRLIRESPGILVPVTLSNYNQNCDMIRTAISQQIQNELSKHSDRMVEAED
jgi:hypothetical protein